MYDIQLAVFFTERALYLLQSMLSVVSFSSLFPLHALPVGYRRRSTTKMTYLSALKAVRPVKCYDVLFSSGDHKTARQCNVPARYVRGKVRQPDKQLWLMSYRTSRRWDMCVASNRNFFSFLGTLSFTEELNISRVRGGAVGWGTALQTGRSRVRFPMESPEFLSDLILLVTLWPLGRLSL
jgi:hypothetical protein